MNRNWRKAKSALFAGALWLAAPAPAREPPSSETEVADIEAALEEATAELGRALKATPAPPAAPQPEPRPALWLLQDSDTKIYLFGTFHILPPDFRWRSPALEAAVRDAGELVLEIADEDAMQDREAVLAQLRLGKQAPLAWRVSPDRRAALNEMLMVTGLPPQTFDEMKTWAATMMIAVLQMVRQYGEDQATPAGIEDMPGVEDQLRRDFAGSGRPISGVETVAQQLGFFQALSFAEERRLLEEMIDAYRSGETSEDVSELDWVRGNVDAVAIPRDSMPEALYDALITRRNRAWTEWLIQRLDRPGTILFAVGAGHLAGPDSVQTMLATRGFTATRIH